MRVLFLLLTIGIGVLLNAPYHNFQNYLAQGDHGRDLYAAQAVLKGDLPYKDFWWVYGPLMPYYYALFFKTLGTQISSVLIGKAALNIGAGVFFFLAFSRLFPFMAAFMAAIWFMAFHQDFFFTYNHAGGIAVLLAVVWMHCGYIKQSLPKYAWGALVAVFVLGLIKINFAIVALLMTIAVVSVKFFFPRHCEERSDEAISKTGLLRSARNDTNFIKFFYATALLIIPLSWFGIYAWLTQGLSVTEIRQCLPYLGGDEPYNNVGLAQTLPLLFQMILQNIRSSLSSFGLCGLFLMCTAVTLKKLSFAGDNDRKILLLTLGYAVLFYILNLHEFFKSGVGYRTFWSGPFTVFLTFVMIATAVANLKPLIRWSLWGALIVILALSYNNNLTRANAYKNPQHYLGGSRGGIYVTNDRAWLQTVVLTTKQLGTAFNKDELFLALPYDCLYYYLTGKKSPTRQLIFFDHIKITLDQEQTILADLERNHIAGVLVSSRQSSREQGLGTLGVSYCPMIAQYINTNFVPVSKLGDWDHEAGWAWNHGTLILKRKP